MSLFGSLLKNLNTKHLVFDISSGTISGALVEKNQNGEVNIIKYFKEVLPFNKPISGKNIHKSMLDSLDKIIHNLSKISGRAHSAHFVMSSPWITAETKNIQAKFDKPIIITKEIILTAIRNEERKFFELMSTDKDKEKMTVIESKATDIKINGYSTESVSNQATKSFDVSIFVSLSTERIINEIKRTLYRHYKVSDVSFHSSAFASLYYLSSTGHDTRDLVFINIHGEITELLHVNKGRISGWGNIPIGTRTLIRKYAEKSKINNHMAISDLSMIINNTLNSASKDIRLNLLEEIQSDWTKEVKSILLKFMEEISVPQMFYINADFN